MSNRDCLPTERNPEDSSRGEWICQDFFGYLHSLSKQGQCFFLPFEVKRLRLHNIGKFTDFETRFNKYNVVLGRCGTGKTTLVRSIGDVIDRDSYSHGGIFHQKGVEGDIEIDTADNNAFHLEIPGGKGEPLMKFASMQCLLIDDPGRELTIDGYQKLLSYLRGLEGQIIMTMGPGESERLEAVYNVFPSCNIIQLQ